MMKNDQATNMALLENENSGSKYQRDKLAGKIQEIRLKEPHKNGIVKNKGQSERGSKEGKQVDFELMAQ